MGFQRQVHLQCPVAVEPPRAEQGRDPVDALVEGVDVDVERRGGTGEVAVAGEVREAGADQVAAAGLVVVEQRADGAADETGELLASRLAEQDWTDFGSRNVIVTDGVVHLWGLVGSEEERKALTALAEDVPGVVRVSDEMIPAYQ